VNPAAALSHIAFQDPARAAQNLARVREHVPPGVAESLPTLLSDSPDPDSALNLFERLCAAGNTEVLRLMDRHRYLIHYAVVVFGYSLYLGETLIQNPDLFHALARERHLDRTHSREDHEESLARFRSRSFESDPALLLARFKRREYIRIMLRDVLGIATLAETTAEISALADVLIEEALRECDTALRARYGAPLSTDPEGRVAEPPFAVLSLGKLGGLELNYSSDVDLLFLYGDGEPAEPGTISNREYFIRLAQDATELLSRVTREGAVFRIDLRLRPQGREGEPAVPLSHALGYYRERAHDWELQAMIKARHSAGNQALAREFIRAVQPHIYRKELNFAAIETALDTREKISAHRRRASTASSHGRLHLDVKLERGGIRDIEFLVQCLQRVYGGSEPWLRSGGTLFSLHKLHDKGHLAGKDFHDLNSGYEFLRRVEHRLQLRRGQQTHRLPEAEAELQVMARAVMGTDRGEVLPDDFVATVRQRMAAVAEIYQRIIHSQQQQKLREGPEPGFRLYMPPAELGRELTYDQILHRLAVDAPALYEVAARRELATHARRNLHRFLSASFTSSERYAAVTRDPQAVERALRIFAVSDYLTDILIRHPEEIATVREIGDNLETGAEKELFAPGGEAVSGEDPVFEHIAKSEAAYGEKLALLRQQFRHRVFAAGARDLVENRPVYESLAETTAVADAAIRAAAHIAGSPEGFAVLALGRLGSCEFDIASDADLLFVRDEAVPQAQGTRTAEQMVEVLSAYTREGTVFAVDPRLRPRGAEGELVHTPEHLAEYFASDAQAWEALTYTKLRPVAGSPQLADRTWQAVQRGLARFAAHPDFPAAVRDMRGRLEKSEPAEPNFKTTPGGFFDIDFIVSYLVVRRQASDVRGNIRVKLHQLATRGWLSDNDCATLDSAGELLRTLEHVIRLVQGRARKSLPAAEQARETTERLTARLLGRELAGGLEAELERSFQGVRRVYERVVV
jgi:glutamate-ammonia-ligase adenylyltransferase